MKAQGITIAKATWCFFRVGPMPCCKLISHLGRDDSRY